MKKILLITSVLMIAMSLNSCGYKAKIEAATAKSDSLLLVMNKNNDIINQTFTDIDQIAITLAQITEREKIVTSVSDGEISQTTKKRISDNIAAIDELLQKNRAAIARLSSSSQKLKQANINITSLDTLVASLQSQLQQKDADLSQMSADLANLKIEITELKGLNITLSEQKESLEGTVATQDIDLNTVYWIVGLQKEMIEHGILDKKGFIGRTLVLKDVADFGSFTKGDMRTIEKIRLDKKGVKVVSSHPEGSYELIMADKNRTRELVITDKEAFWKTSKTLVISYTK